MDYYTQNAKDANGNVIYDEYKNPVTEKVYVVDGVEVFVGGSEEQFCKVRGTGTLFLPLSYMDNNGTSKRYATFTVRRLDTGETRVMNISQAK
jgi:hypothetical protein